MTSDERDLAQCRCPSHRGPRPPEGPHDVRPDSWWVTDAGKLFFVVEVVDTYFPPDVPAQAEGRFWPCIDVVSVDRVRLARQVSRGEALERGVPAWMAPPGTADDALAATEPADAPDYPGAGGALLAAQGSATARDVADYLGVPLRDAVDSLALNRYRVDVKVGVGVVGLMDVEEVERWLVQHRRYYLVVPGRSAGDLLVFAVPLTGQSPDFGGFEGTRLQYRSPRGWYPPSGLPADHANVARLEAAGYERLADAVRDSWEVVERD